MDSDSAGNSASFLRADADHDVLYCRDALPRLERVAVHPEPTDVTDSDSKTEPTT